MSIFIATPAYGGQVTLPYHNSCLALQEVFLTVGIKFEWCKTTNESLITRARNIQASTFLFETDFESLLFIDADIEFTPEDVSKLWNMDKDIAVGAYSRKKVGSYTVVWKNGKEVDIKSLSGITKIDLAGTGFMLIKRRVFEHLLNVHPEWSRRDGKVWAFFQDDGCDESEDYFFCNRAKELGYEVMLDPSIKLGHYGMYRYGDFH